MIAIKVKFRDEVDFNNEDHMEWLRERPFCSTGFPFITTDRYGFIVYQDSFPAEYLLKNVFEMGEGLTFVGFNLQFKAFDFEGVINLSYEEFPKNLIERSVQEIDEIYRDEIVGQYEMPEKLLPETATPAQKWTYLMDFWTAAEESEDDDVDIDPIEWMSRHPTLMMH